ncbi:MAG: hypothetical protein M1602_05240 [Firmicutes bacterium]|nr:hypothetical protein [Bacillota bacterium]
MTARWSVSNGMPAIMGMALLATTLFGCASQPASTTGEVAGARSAQQATITPTASRTAAVASPTALGTTDTATPTAGAATPTALPTVPPAVARSLADVYANIDWFQGVVTVASHPG